MSKKKYDLRNAEDLDEVQRIILADDCGDVTSDLEDFYETNDSDGEDCVETRADSDTDHEVQDEEEGELEIHSDLDDTDSYFTGMFIQ